MYDLLKGAQIDFDFQQVFLLQPKFKYNGEAVRAITWRADFWLPIQQMVIDCKGFANDVAPLKIKMAKQMFLDAGQSPKFELPKNRHECDLLLNRILFEK